VFIVCLSCHFDVGLFHVIGNGGTPLAVLDDTYILTNAYIYDQDCVGACHLKNNSFVITYLLEDEQELSLGMLDTSPMYL
jgi:hypothetical protein